LPVPRSRPANRPSCEHTGYGGAGPPGFRSPVPCRESRTGSFTGRRSRLVDYLTHTLLPFNRRGPPRRYTRLVHYGRAPTRSLRCRARADALRERRNLWAEAPITTIPTLVVRTFRGARWYAGFRRGPAAGYRNGRAGRGPRSGRVPARCGPRRAEPVCRRRGRDRPCSTGSRRPRTHRGPRERNGAPRTLPSPVADIQRAAVARTGRRSRAAGFVCEDRPGDSRKPRGTWKGHGCQRHGIFRQVPHPPSAGRGRLRCLGRVSERRPRVPVPAGNGARPFGGRSPIEKGRERG
jgi:hypothetical protein